MGRLLTVFDVSSDMHKLGAKCIDVGETIVGSISNFRTFLYRNTLVKLNTFRQTELVGGLSVYYTGVDSELVCRSFVFDKFEKGESIYKEFVEFFDSIDHDARFICSTTTLDELKVVFCVKTEIELLNKLSTMQRLHEITIFNNLIAYLEDTIISNNEKYIPNGSILMSSDDQLYRVCLAGVRICLSDFTTGDFSCELDKIDLKKFRVIDSLKVFSGVLSTLVCILSKETVASVLRLVCRDKAPYFRFKPIVSESAASSCIKCDDFYYAELPDNLCVVYRNDCLPAIEIKHRINRQTCESVPTFKVLRALDNPVENVGRIVKVLEGFCSVFYQELQVSGNYDTFMDYYEAWSFVYQTVLNEGYSKGAMLSNFIHSQQARKTNSFA